MKFSVNSEMGFRFFLMCRGDKFGMCNKCKARFCCYTGELPVIAERNMSSAVMDTLEKTMGINSNINMIAYDFDSHDDHYKTECVRDDSRFLGIRQSKWLFR